MCLTAVGVAIGASARSLTGGDRNRMLDAEVEAVRASGLADRERAAEAPELVAARAQLEVILERIVDEDAEGRFGAPWMQRPERAELLAAGLAQRAGLLAALDALPGVLWDSAREPSRSPRQRDVAKDDRLASNALLNLRAATNLLCGQAWHAARESAGAGEAGYRLALAWALARVTDSGGGLELGLRVSWEGIVVETLERLRAEGIVDREILDAPLLSELARDERSDRLRLAIECDLVAAVEVLDSGRGIWDRSLEGPGREQALSDSLGYLRFHRALLIGDLSQRRSPPFVPGMVPAEPWYAHVLDIHTLARDLRAALRARILCAGSPSRP